MSSSSSSSPPLYDDLSVLTSFHSSHLWPHTMSPLEMRYLPEFINHQSFYLRLRSLILIEFLQRPGDLCDFSKISKSVDSEEILSAKRIFQFLDQFGFINMGITKGKKNFHSFPSVVPPNKNPKKILIIGAGASGLSAGRQLKSFGHDVILLDGRDRVGGRVFSDGVTFNGAVDLGASIITGLQGNPIHTIIRQMALSDREIKVPMRCINEGDHSILSDFLHFLHANAPIYSLDGKLLDSEEDEFTERTFNRALDGTNVLRVLAGYDGPGRKALAAAESQNFESEEKRDGKKLRAAFNAMSSEEVAALKNLSLSDGISLVLKILGISLNTREEKSFQWHVANLEYAVATSLRNVSMFEWDQDDEWGWDGQHSTVKGGYSTIINRLAEGQNIMMGRKVVKVEYGQSNGESSMNSPCRVTAINALSGAAETFDCDVVLCSASLGVLKSQLIEWSPPLPPWKQSSIDRLGFGLLNKLVLQFPSKFWDDGDMFGSLRERTEGRGKFYIFWNLSPNTKENILVALLTGDNAEESEEIPKEELVDDCMGILKRIFGQNIPFPEKSLITRWRSDEFARGSYSFVHTGSSGEDYDILAKPIGESEGNPPNVFFCGEATNRQYPATVPGAFLSGLRAAGSIQQSAMEIIEIPIEQRKTDAQMDAERKRKMEKLKGIQSAVGERAKESLSSSSSSAVFSFDSFEFLQNLRNRRMKRRGIRMDANAPTVSRLPQWANGGGGDDDDEEIKKLREEEIREKLKEKTRRLLEGMADTEDNEKSKNFTQNENTQYNKNNHIANQIQQSPVSVIPLSSPSPSPSSSPEDFLPSVLSFEQFAQHSVGIPKKRKDKEGDEKAGGGEGGEKKLKKEGKSSKSSRRVSLSSIDLSSLSTSDQKVLNVICKYVNHVVDKAGGKEFHGDAESSPSSSSSSPPSLCPMFFPSSPLHRLSVPPIFSDWLRSGKSQFKADFGGWLNEKRKTKIKDFIKKVIRKMKKIQHKKRKMAEIPMAPNNSVKTEMSEEKSAPTTAVTMEDIEKDEQTGGDGEEEEEEERLDYEEEDVNMNMMS